MDEVCSNNACIPKPTHQVGDVVAELRLLNQVREGDTSIIGHLGKAESEIEGHVAPPTDDRESWSVPTGRCRQSFELGKSMDYTGAYVTHNLGKGVGKITFNVADAPGKIVLVEANWDDDPNDEYANGYVHFHEDEPPALKQGAATYSDMFDPSYVSLGSPFDVQLAGGVDFGPQTFSANLMPQPFTITDPPDYNVTKKTLNLKGGLTVSWGPAEPGALMEVFIVGGGAPGADYMPLTACIVKDTGSLTIPPEALTPFFGETTIQLRKQVVRYHTATAKGGAKAHFYVMGRHARLREFYADL